MRWRILARFRNHPVRTECCRIPNPPGHQRPLSAAPAMRGQRATQAQPTQAVSSEHRSTGNREIMIEGQVMPPMLAPNHRRQPRLEERGHTERTHDDLREICCPI